MTRALTIGLILLPLVVGGFLYGQLPEQMIIHFNASGEPDGYQGKQMFFLSYAVISLILFALTGQLHKLDPKRKNYEKFPKAYSMIRLVLALIVGGAFSHLLAVNLGMEVDVRMVAFALLGIAWMVIGNYLTQVRSNYFIGIRTPWTLASEEVWRKTHRMAGPLWLVLGLLMLVAAFFPGLREIAWLPLLLIGLSVLVPMIYSYYVYKKMGAKA